MQKALSAPRISHAVKNFETAALNESRQHSVQPYANHPGLQLEHIGVAETDPWRQPFCAEGKQRWQVYVFAY
jgi:hypothetical protein